jgi:Uncharacterized conserved protein (DUF2190)
MSQQSMPVLSLSIAATGTIVANRFVTKAGAQTGADGYALGVARTDAASGGRVTVDVIGTSIVEAGAAVSAGDTLKVDSSGRGITWATSGAKVGLALEAAGAAGQFIEVLLIPNVA